METTEKKQHKQDFTELNVLDVEKGFSRQANIVTLFNHPRFSLLKKLDNKPIKPFNHAKPQTKTSYIQSS